MYTRECYENEHAHACTCVLSGAGVALYEMQSAFRLFEDRFNETIDR